MNEIIYTWQELTEQNLTLDKLFYFLKKVHAYIEIDGDKHIIKIDFTVLQSI